MMRERETRPEFRDPSDFPCMVADCTEHVAGWVIEPFITQLGIRKSDESDRVYLCALHLAPVREPSPMGSILVARCECGYESDSILSGSGMEPSNPSLPGRCSHCRAVVTVRMSGKRLRCSRCGRKPEIYELYDPRSLGERFDQEARHPCPACGDERLRFEFSGVWD